MTWKYQHLILSSFLCWRIVNYMIMFLFSVCMQMIELLWWHSPSIFAKLVFRNIKYSFTNLRWRCISWLCLVIRRTRRRNIIICCLKQKRRCKLFMIFLLRYFSFMMYLLWFQYFTIVINSVIRRRSHSQIISWAMNSRINLKLIVNRLFIH